ncbi:MAG TPA: PrgI family protein [Patescibacteria group bacterium]|nr:PrgI family protein [Patescibacteria group bacterium]
MEQHPVPQPITSYEFRLVGDMTLRQFGKLAAGIVLALIVYAINPPSFIKWFLILLFGGVGAAAAFVPFEGRPIDVWIIAFFKRIYSPTQYTWKKRGEGEDLISTKKTTSPVSPLPLVKPLSAPTAPPSPAITRSTPPPPLVSPPRPATIFQAPSIPKPPLAPAVAAKFTNMAIPATPSMPNLLSGFAHDQQGKIIESAILEIRDVAGNPVRAFRTNKLGQFRSATPLPSGLYEIETEREGYRFDIIKVELKGEIISPIEVISK